MVTLLVVLVTLCFGGCQGGGDESGSMQLAEGEDILFEGHVTDVDATPMFVDGDGLLYVQTEEYGDVTVHIPARERQCRAEGLEVFSTIDSGDTVRVRGRVSGHRAVTVCEDGAHFLERRE